MLPDEELVDRMTLNSGSIMAAAAAAAAMDDEVALKKDGAGMLAGDKQVAGRLQPTGRVCERDRPVGERLGEWLPA